MVEAFNIPLKFKLDAEAKRFIEEIKLDVSGPKGGGGGLGAIAGLGVIAGGIGLIATGIIEIVKKLDVFKPVMALVGSVIKILGEFLRPISDVIILLLMPILQILRPILLVVRQIMQPFRQAAFALSRQAGEARAAGDTGTANILLGLSLQEITLGVQAVFGFFTVSLIQNITSVLGEITKLIANLLINLFAPILQVFGVDVEALSADMGAMIDSGVKAINDFAGVAIASFILIQQGLITKAAENVGGNIQKEFGLVKDTLNDTFVGENNSFKSVFEDLATGIQGSFNNIDSAMGSFVDGLERTAVRIRSIDTGGGRSRSSFVNKVSSFFGIKDRSSGILNEPRTNI